MDTVEETRHRESTLGLSAADYSAFSKRGNIGADCFTTATGSGTMKNETLGITVPSIDVSEPFYQRPEQDRFWSINRPQSGDDKIPEPSLYELCEKINTDLTIFDRAQLANRILELNAIVKEEENTSVNMVSVAGLIDFMKKNPAFRRPNLSLSDENYLEAHWTGPDRSVVTIRFAPNNEVYYLIIVPASDRPNQRVHRNGPNPTSTILETLDFYGASALLKTMQRSSVAA